MHVTGRGAGVAIGVVLAVLAGCAAPAGSNPPGGTGPEVSSGTPAPRVSSPQTATSPPPSARASTSAASPDGGPSTSAGAKFAWSQQPLSASQQAAMRGVSWRAGCPVPLSDLRLLTVRHWNFDGEVRTGQLIVHKSVTSDLARAFERLFAQRFPIARMQPIEAYGGDDWQSIEANNSSAFNCRLRTGSTTQWSQHSYGTALDLNPIQNPYVTTRGETSHRASVTYLNRRNVRPGMLTAGSGAVRAFADIGWKWGGLWAPPIDYQHFSTSGR